MDLKDILEKQSKKKKKVAPPKAATMSIEDYSLDDDSRRPYKPASVNAALKKGDIKKTSSATGSPAVDVPPSDAEIEVKAIDAPENTLTVNKRKTNGEQVVSSPKDNITSSPYHRANTSPRPTVTIASKKGLSSLVGVQRKMVIAMYESMKLNNSFQTQELTISKIANMTGEKAGVIKTNLYRLKQKGLLFLVEYKDGRGGWGKYSLDEELLRDLQKQF